MPNPRARENPDLPICPMCGHHANSIQTFDEIIAGKYRIELPDKSHIFRCEMCSIKYNSTFITIFEDKHGKKKVLFFNMEDHHKNRQAYENGILLDMRYL